jgi:protein-disulfide isomerase
VVVIAGAIAWWLTMAGDGSDVAGGVPAATSQDPQSPPSPRPAAATSPQQTAAPPAAQDVDEFVAAALAERAMGDPDAPVTIFEYASMTCPHCAEFHNQHLEKLKTRYIDTGKVRLVFRNFVLNAVDLRASMMSRCAPEERFFDLVEVLFRTQGSWALATDPVAELAKIGRLSGIDEATFNSCLGSEALVNGLIQLREAGSAEGVASTPTFIINGERVVGSRTADELAEIIEPLLEN